MISIPDCSQVFGSDPSLSNLKCVLCNFEDAMGSFMSTVVELKEKRVMDRLCIAINVRLRIQQGKTDSIVARIKRHQDKLHERMLVSAAKKFCPANIGDNTVIPIEKPDK